MRETTVKTSRPNVLVIIADQLRADHLGFAGNPTVRTPNIDRLAESGMVFNDARVTNPTCAPNRASLLTGRWPSAHGTRCNGITMDPDANTMVRNMARDGYETIAVGKLHHQNMGWPFEADQREQIDAADPLLLSPDHADATTHQREPGWDQWENRAAHESELLPMPKDYYGYQHVDLIIGHGDNPGGHYRHWVTDHDQDPDQYGGAEHARKTYPGWEQVYESAVEPELHPGSYVRERVNHHLRRCADEQKPFFLFASFPDPHHPFSPPAGYSDLYSPDEIPLPVGFHQDHSRSPAHIQQFVERRGQPGDDSTMTWSATEDQYRHSAAAQYGQITFLDEQVGQILDTLETSGLAEDTIVVFTSDHGDLFGDHGLMLKHFSHYRAVTEVPLIIRAPGLSTDRCSNALVSTADIAPTLLQMTGTSAYRGIQGKSLVPLLRGEVGSVREALLIEEDQPFGVDGLPAPVITRTVITGQGRLTRYFGTYITELYDYRTDPDELDNLADQPAARELQQSLTVTMLEQMAALQVFSTAPTSSA